VVAIGVRQDGSREVLGFDVGASETYEFWAGRSSCGSWWGGGCEQKLPRHAQGPIAALVRTIFASAGPGGTGRQLDQVCATLRRRFPQVAHMLQEAAEEVLTYMHFPPES
jgi:putative transposase